VLNFALSIASEASSRPTGRALSDGMAETEWRTLPSAPALSARARVVYGTMLRLPPLWLGTPEPSPGTAGALYVAMLSSSSVRSCRLSAFWPRLSSRP